MVMVSVCLEATGLYSLGVALALHRHRHTQVMVVNPKAMSKYAQACMQRAKTDAKDALLILDPGLPIHKDASRKPGISISAMPSICLPGWPADTKSMSKPSMTNSLPEARNLCRLSLR